MFRSRQAAKSALMSIRHSPDFRKLGVWPAAIAAFAAKPLKPLFLLHIIKPPAAAADCCALLQNLAAIFLVGIGQGDV